MILNTNVQALFSTNALWHRNNALEKTSTNLSLGIKINKSGDDPSGLAISNKMRMQIKGIEIASRNTIDAISLVQVAEGGLTEVASICQRMRELAVNASNDTLSKKDRELVQIEINELVDEIDSISNKIEFNKKPLLNDDYEDFIFQIGGSEEQDIKLELKKIDSKDLGVHTRHTGPKGEKLLMHTKVGSNGEELLIERDRNGVPVIDNDGNVKYEMVNGNYQTTATPPVEIEPEDVKEPNIIEAGESLYIKNNAGAYYTKNPVTPNPNPTTPVVILPNAIIKRLDYTTSKGAQDAIKRCDSAISDISEYRSRLGATQNRLDNNNNSLMIAEENTKVSLSRILDTDMAKEMSEYTKNNVLVQSGIAMLSQANQRPNQLLSLLQ